MQTGVGSLNLTQVVGSLVAGALVLCGFWGLFWLKKRRRKERKERPPQREKLLRPAGYSAMCRIDALSEKWMSAAAQAVGAGMFFGLTVGTFYLKGVRRVFSPEQLETTIRRLDERRRVLEF